MNVPPKDLYMRKTFLFTLLKHITEGDKETVVFSVKNSFRKSKDMKRYARTENNTLRQIAHYVFSLTLQSMVIKNNHLLQNNKANKLNFIELKF